MRFKDKVVWITGGGTGIGFAVAKRFAAEGAKVAVSGRRIEKLEEAVAQINDAGGDAIAVGCDVTDEAQVEAAVETVVETYGKLDVAIANAGFSVSGTISQLSADDWRRQFDVNVVGAAITAKHAIPELQKTKGRLALIGSVSGIIASPGVGAYHASKYAVRALGQVLSMELSGTGVTCTTVHPGFVESEIARVDNEGNFREEWRDKRPAKLMWSSEKAASTIVRAIHKRKREFTFTFHGKVASFLGQHSPGLVHFAVTRFVKGDAAYERKGDA